MKTSKHILMILVSMILLSGCESSQHHTDRLLYRAEWNEYALAQDEDQSGRHNLENYNLHMDRFDEYSKQRAILEGVYK